MRRLFVILSALVISSLLPTTAQVSDFAKIAAAKAAYDDAPTEAKRDALFRMLEQYQGDATVQTVNAYLTVLAHDLVSGEYAKMRESAAVTAQHLDPVQDIVPRQYIMANFIAATALFNAESDPDAMLEMAHVQGRANQFRNAQGEHPDWAVDLRWRAEAWLLAMDAFFEQARDKHPSEDDLDAILNRYPVANTTIVSQSETIGALPFCQGRIRQVPKMRYPGSANRDEVVGAVIVAFDLDVDGNVIHPRVRAAIPSDAFEDAILETISKWSYRANKRKEIGVTCQLERTNIVMPFTFLFK